MGTNKITNVAETLFNALGSFRFKYQNGKGYYKANGLDNYIPFCTGNGTSNTTRSTKEVKSKIEVLDLSSSIVNCKFDYLVNKNYEHLVFLIYGENSDVMIGGPNVTSGILGSSFFRTTYLDDYFIGQIHGYMKSSSRYYRDIYYLHHYFTHKNTRIVIDKIPESYDKCILYGITSGTDFRMFAKNDRNAYEVYPYYLSNSGLQENKITILPRTDLTANLMNLVGVEFFCADVTGPNDYEVFLNDKSLTEEDGIITIKTKNCVSKYGILLDFEYGDVLKTNANPYIQYGTEYYSMDYMGMYRGCV